ncbi:MAG: hypothetical protein ACT4N4_10100, partial [Rhodospirillales bacterium]
MAALGPALAALAACVTPSTTSVTSYGWIEERGNPRPTLEKFTVCHDYGCATRTAVRLPAEEWQEVRGLFKEEATDSGEERRRIAEAIGKIEVAVGRLTGTSNDRGGTLNSIALSGQMDCVDEAVNTTTYLVLMEQDGLIKRHKAQSVAWRGTLFGKVLPHVTPVMADTGSGELWTVDSSFFDNGKEPVI